MTISCKFLLSKGFSLLQQNYRCRYGEIDLIMSDKEDIVFVEVRSRSRTDYGRAGESINASKKKKLIKTATLFLQTKDWLYKVHSRFDVIEYFRTGSQRNADQSRAALLQSTQIMPHQGMYDAVIRKLCVRIRSPNIFIIAIRQQSSYVVLK